MPFIPGEREWIKGHFKEVASHTISQIGSLKGKLLLDVGCGDMLSDIGLAAAGAKSIKAIDVTAINIEMLHASAKRIKNQTLFGFPRYRIPKDYAERIEPISYNGEDMPFTDNYFDIVFSWGVFEHVMNVPKVLSEMKRVMKPDGVCFIKVFPWYHGIYGAHIFDYVSEPFAHLTQSEEWISKRIEEYGQKNPDRKQIADMNWSDRVNLNRYSAEMFYRDVQKTGWSTQRWTPLTYPVDLTLAPKDVSFADLVICGSECILTK